MNRRLGIGVVVAVCLAAGVIKVSIQNYYLGQQAEALRVETQVLEAQRDILTYQIRYYNTDAYRERQAKEKLGLKMPDEEVIIIPR